MSGGHFEYKHHYIQDIIDSIQKEIDCNKTPNEEWYCNNFNADTIQTFKEALYHLNNAYNYAHAIDYLLCWDTSEDSHRKFLSNLFKK